MRAPDSFVIRLPPEWQEFPIDAAGLAQVKAEAVSKLQDDPNWSPTMKRRLDLMFVQFDLALRSVGAAYCAYFAGVSGLEDGAEAEAQARLIVAGLVVSTLSREELGTKVPLTPDTLLAAYTLDRESGQNERATNIEPPAVVELGEPGRSVRLVRLMEVGRAADQPSSVFAETFLIPVSDGDGVCVLQFTTLNLEEAPSFSELFGAIARTIRVLYEGTPTFPEGASVS